MVCIDKIQFSTRRGNVKQFRHDIIQFSVENRGAATFKIEGWHLKRGVFAGAQALMLQRTIRAEGGRLVAFTGHGKGQRVFGVVHPPLYNPFKVGVPHSPISAQLFFTSHTKVASDAPARPSPDIPALARAARIC